MRVRVKSITYALKAKEILESSGITAAVVKDLRLSGGGCVYAVSFPEKYKRESVNLLYQNGVAIHSTESWDELL